MIKWFLPNQTNQRDGSFGLLEMYWSIAVCIETCQRHNPTLWRYRFGKFDGLFTKKIFYHQLFFAVKRRAVFILGAKWKALARGWRRDCVVGGMETRFQWRKAHNPSTKCEAFHFAPRLFFMFLFLIPFTIRQHCIIYSPEMFHWARTTHNVNLLNLYDIYRRKKSGCLGR